jgi:hypothetical protein
MLANTDNFYNNDKSPDGINTYCKKCSVKKFRKWENDNWEQRKGQIRKNNARPEFKEQHRESEKRRREEGKTLEWQQNNKDKVKEYGEKRQHKKHNIKKKEWKFCKEYFGFKCAYCNLPIEEHWIKYRVVKLGDFHKEHVDHFGANDLSNCVPSCKTCNSSKWEFKFEDWYPQQEFYSKENYDKIVKWITVDYKKFVTQ